MNPTSDLHLHTTFCDGKHTPREMVEQALALGYRSLGICCHSPLPFENDWSAQNELAFKKEVLSLKEEYKNRIFISLGIECDNVSEVPDGYDYVIASVHHLDANGESVPVDEGKDVLLALLQNGFGGDKDALAKAYFEAVVENVKRLRPHVIGHFDLLTKYAEVEPALVFDSPAYFEMGKAAQKALVSLCPVLEVNVGAISRRYRTYPYPHAEFLSYWRSLGGKVTVTSDAHSKDTLAFAFDKAVALLRLVGYTSVLELQSGAFKEISIL